MDPITMAMSAGFGLADNMISASGQRAANRANKELAQQQQQWNEQMWHQQNAYNHPQQQMARLSEAGLNPHLIYGTSPSSAVGTAGDVKGYDRAESRNVMEGFQAFGNMYRFSNLQAQTDNLKAQQQVAEQDAVKKSYETLQTAINTKKQAFDLGLAKDLRDTSIQAAVANSEKAVSEAQRSMTEANVAQATADPRIKQAKVQLETALSQKKGQDLLNELRRIEINLNRAGVQKSDNVMLRMLMQNPTGRKVMDFLLGTGNSNPFK